MITFRLVSDRYESFRGQVFNKIQQGRCREKLVLSFYLCKSDPDPMWEPDRRTVTDRATIS